VAAEAGALKAWFLAGGLESAPLRDLVIGRAVAGVPARLSEFRICLSDQGLPARLVKDENGAVDGLCLTGLSETEDARLQFYANVAAGGFGTVTVSVGSHGIEAHAPGICDAVGGGGRARSDPKEWQALWGPVVTYTAADVMAGFGVEPAGWLAARYPQMLVRGASRVRAAAAVPTRVRRRAVPEDVAVTARKLAYAGFFALEDYTVGWKRFRGDMGPPAERAVFVSGDAVTVLPYDPRRDRVLVIEQFRVGAMARGDGQPWLLEPIAGRIDPGETAEAAARREAVEEAGLTLGQLLPVAGYYPSPGAKTEFLYSFVAIADLPDGAAGVFGLASEAEDIRGHVLGFEDFMALVTSGEANTAPLILSALWLQRERPRLRAAHMPGS
jgi:ADP-ribose pyrophosphatase